VVGLGWPAVATTQAALQLHRLLQKRQVRKVLEGLNELNEGKGIPGEQAEAELKAASKAFRARKPK
jgi:hypothetical protein